MLVYPSPWSQLRETLKKTLFLGNDPNPELVAILLVYFVQGILGLARLSISFFLKDDLGLSPAQSAALTGITALPWMVKPLFGFLSDGFPVFGYHRRPYLVVSGFLGTVGWVLLATVAHGIWVTGGAIALTTVSVAMSDVIVDSLVVERARRESLSQAGSLQVLCWGTSAIGGIVTAYLSGFLLEFLSTQVIFWITATFPLIVAIVAVLITEDRDRTHTGWAAVKDQMGQLYGAVTQKRILLPTAFLFIWLSTPTEDSALFYFLTNDLGFEPEFLGRLRLVTSVAALVGLGLYQRFFREISFRRIFAWSILLSMVLGLLPLLLVTHANRALGIDDRWFSVGSDLVFTVAGQIAFMPVLVMAARLCPPGVEASLFALLMSVSNLARFLSQESGALLTHGLGVTETDFTNLWLLLLIANGTTLIPLLFLKWVPAGDCLPNPPEYVLEASPIPGESRWYGPLVVLWHQLIPLSWRGTSPDLVASVSGSPEKTPDLS